MRLKTVHLTFLVSLLLFFSISPAWSQCASCPSGNSESVFVAVPGAFSGGGLNGSFADATTLFGATGGNDFFTGAIFALDPLPTDNLDELCMLIDIDVQTDVDLAANPITFEFRLENICGGFPCPWIDFNTTITSTGPTTVGSTLSAGNNTGFDPTQPYQIVIAFANFSGTPLSGDITINYSQPTFDACAAAPAVSCAPCPAGTISESLFVDEPGFFQGGNLNGSVPNFNTLLGTAGSEGFFIGSTFGTESLPFTNLADLCVLIDIDVQTDVDLAANPITFEFRIENLCGGFPCPWVDFNTVITSAGPTTIGGNLTMGNNTGFNPTQPYQIVIAFANFSGVPLAGDIAIVYDQPELIACVPESNCEITAINAVTQTECNPATNTFSQTLEIEYIDPPAGGALNVNGEFFPITGSPQTVTLNNLSSTGVAGSVTASFTDEVLCTLTDAAAYIAPNPCFDFPLDSDGLCTVLYENDVESTNFNQNNLFGFGGDFGGQNWGITDDPVDGGIVIQLTSTAGNPYFYVGFVQQFFIPGGIASYGALSLSLEAYFNQLGNFEFRLESLDALEGNVTGATGGATPVQSVGGFDTYTFNPLTNPGSLDTTSDYYQIVFVATDGGFGNDDAFEAFVDNMSFTNCEIDDLDITREGALCAEPSLPTDGDEVYNWYDEDGNLVASILGNYYYSPSELGTYYVEVIDPDYPGVVQVFNPRTITELNGCCELDED